MTDKRLTARSRHVRSRGPESLTALAEIDRRLLGVLCTHRVVTQEQLCRLFPRVPERTLRYRTRRLHDLGLAGRSRPYREQGSAPNHHWPTRRADCLIRGEPTPRGGERQEPNPLFLAHAAALTDLYVVLATEAHTLDLQLHTFLREEETREPFNDGAKNRSLAPDALLILQDTNGRRLWAMVEIDLGTMSHTRLRQKAALYLAYAKANAWQSRHPFMPVLLFLTTTTSRAHRFLDNLAAMHRRTSHGNTPLNFMAVAGAIAQRPLSLLDDPCLADTNGNSHLMLLDVLNAGRAPYERARAAQREKEQADAAELRALFADAEALRERLRERRDSLSRYLNTLEPTSKATVELLLANTNPPDPDERDALLSIGRDLDTRLLESWPPEIPPPSATALCDIKLLTDHYRRAHERLLAELAHRYGQGPSLRIARCALQGDSLLTHHLLTRLPSDAERDLAGHAEQHQRRLDYEEWRERAARQLAREAGPLGRLIHPREQFYPQLDREHLRVCTRCQEMIYPGPPTTDYYGRRHPEPGACHYCGGQHNYQPYDPDPNTSIESETQP
jgi:hypothetical protein